MKSCMAVGLQMLVLIFEFNQNRLSGFEAVGGRNLPIPIDLAIGLYNSLDYCTSRDISSAILAGSSKLVVGNDCMGPSLQLVRARFSNFILRKLSHELKLHEVSILHELQMAIFPYCLTVESHGWACW